METHRLMWHVFILSIFSVVISGYLFYVHYAPSTDVCLPNGHGGNGCDIVNKSKYSEFFGIPLGLAGMGMFSFLAILSGIFVFDRKIKPQGLNKKKISNYIFYLLLLDLLFVFYLVYVEVYLLHAICTFCTILHIFIAYKFVISWRIRRKLHITAESGAFG